MLPDFEGEEVLTAGVNLDDLVLAALNEQSMLLMLDTELQAQGIRPANPWIVPLTNGAFWTKYSDCEAQQDQMFYELPDQCIPVRALRVVQRRPLLPSTTPTRSN